MYVLILLLGHPVFCFSQLGFCIFQKFSIFFFFSLDANEGVLTNFEVLDFLRSKGAAKDSTRVLAKVTPSEYKVGFFISIFTLSITIQEKCGIKLLGFVGAIGV